MHELEIARSRRRRAVSDVVAVLLLVVIVVGIIGVFVTFAYGLVQSTLIAGPPAYATAIGELNVPGSNSTVGILSIAVRNGGSSAISGITAKCPAQFAAGCSSISFSPSPVPIGQTAISEASVSAASGVHLITGTDYVVLVTVTFASGSVTILPLNVWATS